MAEKQKEKQITAGLLGLLDPIIRQSAEKLASKISGDSILRTKAFETIFGAVKGFVEAYAEKYPALASASVEKVTDFLDFLSVAIANPEHRQSAVKWLDGFLEESGERLKNAQDPQQEFDRINQELELRKKLYESAHGKPADAPKKETGDKENPLEQINTKLESALEKMRARREERRHGDATPAKDG